ncbi:hypothetical protein ES708_05529 [subsurface metagenome]
MAEKQIKNLRQIPGKMPMVELANGKPDEADVAATKLLYEAYLVDGVFVCPRCGVKFPNPEKAVLHLMDEINASMAGLQRVLAAAKPKEK